VSRRKIIFETIKALLGKAFIVEEGETMLAECHAVEVLQKALSDFP
jgi:hypothetical protein